MRVSFTLCEKGGGGGGVREKGGGEGWTFKNVFEALFPRLWKKKRRDIFSQKRSRQAKFQRILSNFKKSLRNRHIGPV